MSKQRWNPLVTPPSWGWSATLVAFWWLSVLVGVLIVNQAEHAIHRLSVGGVVGQWILISIPFVPVAGGATALILRRYPGSVSLWHWNTARPWWSIVWTLGTAWVTYMSFSLFRDLFTFDGCKWLSQILWGEFLYVILVLRAILVARRR